MYPSSQSNKRLWAVFQPIEQRQNSASVVLKGGSYKNNELSTWNALVAVHRTFTSPFEISLKFRVFGGERIDWQKMEKSIGFAVYALKIHDEHVCLDRDDNRRVRLSFSEAPALSVKNGVIQCGGEDAEQHTDKVFVLYFSVGLSLLEVVGSGRIAVEDANACLPNTILNVSAGGRIVLPTATKYQSIVASARDDGSMIQCGHVDFLTAFASDGGKVYGFHVHKFAALSASGDRNAALEGSQERGAQYRYCGTSAIAARYDQSTSNSFYEVRVASNCLQ